MPDYSNSVIYHIRWIETKVPVYVGSTCSFNKRSRGHYDRCNTPTAHGFHYIIYQFIRENGGFDLFEIIPVSFHNLTNKVELSMIEQQEINKYDILTNCRHASRTRYDYRRDTVINKSIYDKKRNTIEITCECGCVIKKKHITTHKKTIKHLKRIEAMALE